MKTHMITIDELTLDSKNARSHNQKNIEAIKASLAKFGQQKPIVISDDGIVVAGNGTVQAARELGWKEISAVKSQLKKNEIKAYAIADNKTTDTSFWDSLQLQEMLDELHSNDIDLFFSTGFTESELDQLLALTNGEPVDPSKEWVDMPEFIGNEGAKRKIVVNFDDDESVGTFFELLGQEYTDKTKSIWWPEKKTQDLSSVRYQHQE